MPKNTTRSLAVGAQHDPWLKPNAIVTVIDPGLTSGYCRVKYLGGVECEFLDAFEIPWEDRFGIGKFLEGSSFLVLERFGLYADKASALTNDQFPSVWISGIVEREAHILNLDLALYLQPATVMQSVKIEPDVLAHLRGSEHMKDAYKHAKYFCVWWGRQQQMAESRKQTLRP